MRIAHTIAAACMVGMSSVTAAHAVQLVTTLDPGFYNNSIGTLLNGTSSAFPILGDPSLDFGPGDAPDLSAAASVLGGWLNPVPDLENGFWSEDPISVPNSWTAGTEVAVVYVFETGGIEDLVGRFGVDNGIFVWLDGVFIGGALRPGGVSLGEHTFNLGDLEPGTHYLQLLLEDHGAASGYAVDISAEVFLPPPPPPPPSQNPAPGALLLFAAGLAATVAVRRTSLRR